MFQRIAISSAAVFVALVLSNCAGNDELTVLSKSKIKTTGYQRSIDVPTPSQDLVSIAASKPQDRHNMPVYSFAERRRLVRTTAYTHSESDHLIYGNKNAAGTQLRYGDKVRSAAADWSFYPLGTTFRIKGLPYLYVVDDYGSALTGTGTIDIYKPSMEIMNLWGRRNVELQVVQWGSFSRSATILSQREKYTHCREMLANIMRQNPEIQRIVAANR